MMNFNLNLEISVCNDGFLMAYIYIVTGIDCKDENVRETLGVFSSLSEAAKNKEFWKNVMGYIDTKVETHILRLN